MQKTHKKSASGAARGGQVAIYAYQAWDRESASFTASPRMGTADAIRQVKGMADLESKRIVAIADLDADGFYIASPR